ncbi:MAG: DUF4238 domain-containing protein [Terriglobales bacterium]
MAGQSTARTDHHYVPQFLLRGFASQKRKQVYVFDKSNDTEFRSSVRNLACQRDFYSPDLDRWLGKLEEMSAPIIQSIRTRRTLCHLQDAEIQWLAGFIAVQQVRTLHHRSVSADINKQLADALRDMGAEPNSVRNFHELTESEIREEVNASVGGLSLDLLPHILNKDWILFSACSGSEFWIGDHPVALANNLNPGNGLRGTLGFGVPGIEVYLPISSELMLGCLCPNIRATFAASQDGRLPPVPRAHEFLRAFDGSIALDLNSENVKYHNSLQVIYAERFVYSEHTEFDMVREMVSSDESLRIGVRPETAGRRKRERSGKQPGRS